MAFPRRRGRKMLGTGGREEEGSGGGWKRGKEHARVSETMVSDPIAHAAK